MKKPILIAAVILALIGGIAAYLYGQHSQPKMEPVQMQAPPPLPPAKPEVRQVIEAVPIAPPLPVLAESDNFMLDALAGLIGNKSLMKLFHVERVIRNIVVTVDNLPRKTVSMKVLPLKPASGSFIAVSNEGELAISPKNAARYTAYVKTAEAMDAKKLVELYVRLYPLFQQAYEELGYPKKYFNDRLIEAIDNLLDTPAIKEPVKLVRPHVFYQFADPELEDRSIGQRILMRIGSANAAVIKTRLGEIKQELKLHMHEKKVESVG